MNEFSLIAKLNRILLWLEKLQLRPKSGIHTLVLDIVKCSGKGQINI
jgi:hypothetical protein